MHFTKCHFDLICIYLSKMYKVFTLSKKWTQHESIDFLLAMWVKKLIFFFVFFTFSHCTVFTYL